MSRSCAVWVKMSMGPDPVPRWGIPLLRDGYGRISLPVGMDMGKIPPPPTIGFTDLGMGSYPPSPFPRGDPIYAHLVKPNMPMRLDLGYEYKY
jgi:hypothetical protein